jgi:hypothetical protein
MSRHAVGALLVGLALALSSCGGGGEGGESQFEAQQEGMYIEYDELTYQVQLSRYLTPLDPEDKQYLTGLPAGVRPELPGTEIWFGVWMRVKNYSGHSAQPTSSFTIVDTQENVYRPIPVAASNPFIYVPSTLLQSQVLPIPNTAAASGPIQGSLILFRLKTESLSNRPLTLRIGETEPARMDIDL